MIINDEATRRNEGQYKVRRIEGQDRLLTLLMTNRRRIDKNRTRRLPASPGAILRMSPINRTRNQ